MTAPSPDVSTSFPITLQPMVHVDNMQESVLFYEGLGASVLHGSRDGDFVMLRIGGGQLSLLAHPPNPEQGESKVELNFEAVSDLAELGPGSRRRARTSRARPPTKGSDGNSSFAVLTVS